MDKKQDYIEFLSSKKHRLENTGLEIDKNKIHPKLFDFQKDIVKWAVKKGRCAVFLDTGLGKTFIQLEWARLIDKLTLIIAPLSVTRQTLREANKIGIDIKYVRSQKECCSKLNITNYELVDHFDGGSFGAVVLDESSILKSLGGKTKQKLITKFSDVKYKLCCSATPAPNDIIELGNHVAFLEVCSHQEMLAMFFINANKEHTFIYDDRIITRKGSNAKGTEWRLKHHAENRFYEWMSQWSITMTKPSDLNYSDDGFILPSLNVTPVFVKHDYHPEGELFFTKLQGLQDRLNVRRDSIKYKMGMIKELIANDDGQFIVWCGLNEESQLLAKELTDCVNVEGSDRLEFKCQSFEDFQDGKYKTLITKFKIGGFGMNFQNASNMIFFGLNDSWEGYYQAIRREWRFGQQNPVNVYLVLSEHERGILENIRRKEKQVFRLRKNMIAKLKDIEVTELHDEKHKEDEYMSDTVQGDGWTAMLGDSCERLKELKKDSIDLSIYSPPFVDLFVYSNSDRDIGNSRGWSEFFEHYQFIIKDVLRTTKTGRLSCVHTSDIPAMANRDGYIGLKDFPGEVIRAHQKAGWIFVGRAYIQKNPQAQAIRVKCKSLLFVQMRKDSSCSRPALIDQILIFKKPGENKVPIKPVDNGDLNNETWIKWAHGIWTDIRETHTLQYYIARDKEDEKHICPLQLDTIERCVKLYSNPGETVLSPFMGIGSECFMVLKLRRKTIGIELKESYFKVAINNLKAVQTNTLFSETLPMKG